MWFKVDDRLHDHKKARGIDCAALGLWTLAGSWCGQTGTDGFVPVSVPPRWSRQWRKHAAELVARGLWVDADREGEAGWEFVNWTEYQPSRQETDIPLDRLRWRRKNALKKNRALCEAIVARDRNRCRYCDQTVDWQDRRSPRGGTYDHIDPNGDNTLENVVVACRRCNGRKKDRTPHEANMILLPIPAPYVADLAPVSGSGSSSAPEQPGAIKDPSLEAVRDQIGTRSTRFGSGSEEPGRVPATNGNGAHP